MNFYYLIALLFFMIGAVLVVLIWIIQSMVRKSRSSNKRSVKIKEGLSELAVLYRDMQTQDLVVKIDGTTFNTVQELSPSQKHRLAFTSNVLSKWLVEPPAPPAPAAEDVGQAAPEEESATPATPAEAILSPLVSNLGAAAPAFLADEAVIHALPGEEPIFPPDIEDKSTADLIRKQESAFWMDIAGEPVVPADESAVPVEETEARSVHMEEPEADVSQADLIAGEVASAEEGLTAVETSEVDASPADEMAGENAPAEEEPVTMAEPETDASPADAMAGETALAEEETVAVAEPETDASPADVMTGETAPAEEETVTVGESKADAPSVDEMAGETAPAEEVLAAAETPMEQSPTKEEPALQANMVEQLPAEPATVEEPAQAEGSEPAIEIPEPVSPDTPPDQIVASMPAPAVAPFDTSLPQPDSESKESPASESQPGYVPPFTADSAEEISPVSTSLPEMVSGILGPTPKPVPSIKSIAMQINDVLQKRLAGTPLDGRGISLSDAPDHGVIVTLDGENYPGIKDVPDEAVQKAIRAAVAEWETAK